MYSLQKTPNKPGYYSQLQDVSDIGFKSWDFIAKESLHTTSVLGFIQRRKWNEQRIREMDNLPVHYTLIYRNPMYNYVSATTFITTASFLAMGGFLAHRLITGEFSFNPEAIETAVAGPLTSDITEVYVMAVFFVLFNLILRITLNRFPLRIYRTGDRFAINQFKPLPHGITENKRKLPQIPDNHVVREWEGIQIVLHCDTLSVSREGRHPDVHD
uniref:Uncharacterized protein n=1 Tax=Phlebotomus papatasi TaxID=29031 RepID=A0A1B0DG00_PHLPP